MLLLETEDDGGWEGFSSSSPALGHAPRPGLVRGGVACTCTLAVALSVGVGRGCDLPRVSKGLGGRQKNLKAKSVRLGEQGRASREGTRRF